MMTSTGRLGPERVRLEHQRLGRENWRLWGPYLSERAWGTVREDYSQNGDAWGHLSHDQARSRAYRWSEDGLGGISDEQQRLCFALALWNGRDSILKERAFGLTGVQGNRGEDVKEYYFYLDATPTHSLLRYLYKYPQSAFPYDALVAENARRSRHEPPFNLLDTGAFGESRYFDVEVVYAKAGPDEIHIRIVAANRGPETAELHVLPTLWFRNTWSWSNGAAKPSIRATDTGGAAWAVEAAHAELGSYWLYGRRNAELLFTDNETDTERLWGDPNATPFVKDAFHRRVIDGAADAVNPDSGTKFASWSRFFVPPGQRVQLELVLTAQPLASPFERTEAVFAAREAEANEFYRALLPESDAEDPRIVRQALAGMIWAKQFFHYDVERWLKGDLYPPPASRQRGRNAAWKHMKAADVISMPDAWEYPWFAAWDLAFHCGALALIDVDFAKDQFELMLSKRYLNPNGQIPAYEWNFGDVNPPVHALAALKAFRAERVQRGRGDHDFLQRAFHKLLLTSAWWINRKDAEGNNIFEGGFLGLDNISVFDRSQPLPFGYKLKQADATGWMAMFALNMTVIALELTQNDPDYEDIAIQTFEQFLGICDALSGYANGRPPLRDAQAGFFKDLIIGPDDSWCHIDVYSMVGLIPLFATEVVDRRLLSRAPRFRTHLRMHKGGLFRGHYVCACPEWENERGEHLLSVVDHTMIQPMLSRLMDEGQFLSPFGVRSVSKIHATHRDLGVLPGVGMAMIEYVPGESTSALFGGNSNWRGPIWLPVNYMLIQAIEKFHRFLGDEFTFAVPCLDNRRLTLNGIANLIAERVANLYRRNADGVTPAMQTQPLFRADPHWRDLLLFYEYFHAETGQGLGASHQTGWTGLIANLVLRHYRKDIPSFWSSQQVREAAE
ncbi:MAG: MGH1-like glycoside hydrolase domain-containing protein [Rhodoplanes sp.]